MAKRNGRDLLARVLAFVGALLLAFSALMPAVLMPALKTIPLSAGGKTVTNEVPAVLLDARAFATGKVLEEHAEDPTCRAEGAKELPVHCFVGSAVPVKGVRNVAAVEPSDKDDITLRAGNVLLRMDKPEDTGLISASVDQVTLDRHDAFPIEEPTSTFHMTAPDLGLDDTTGGFLRDGLQYQFPFGTQPKSYPYFDTTAQKSTPIDFVDEQQFKGRKVLHFGQQVGAVNMFDSVSIALNRDGELTDSEKGVLAGLRLVSTYGRWYTPDEMAKMGVAPEDQVVMTRYYAVARDLLVEPRTGVIVRGQERLHYFFASSQQEAQAAADAHFADPDAPVSMDRSALVATAAWNEDTQDRQFAKADDGASKLRLLDSLHLLGLTLGAILLIIGLFLVYKNRSTKAE
ncbi:DUF3068 domain-containing protein [Corynebacterium aquilae]|uniref:DUF3068 domain-containing protein n=1 Tax=Corynebacterium aquilae TaxID=203263 RepID=UPI00147647A1|nr:DUF3068 domain-containing protein [Corynebacterium aquilae]